MAEGWRTQERRDARLPPLAMASPSTPRISSGPVCKTRNELTGEAEDTAAETCYFTLNFVLMGTQLRHYRTLMDSEFQDLLNWSPLLTKLSGIMLKSDAMLTSSRSRLGCSSLLIGSSWNIVHLNFHPKLWWKKLQQKSQRPNTKQHTVHIITRTQWTPSLLVKHKYTQGC